jgi:hypothetical protein
MVSGLLSTRMAKPRKCTRGKPAKKVPWYEHQFSKSLKAGWIVLCTVIAAVGAIILKGPEVFDNLQKLPADISSVSDKFESWWYENADWTGNWSSFPEGIVDMGDMHLSDTDLKITT